MALKSLPESPCLCLHSISSTGFIIKAKGMQLSTSFLDSWHQSRFSAKSISHITRNGCSRKRHKSFTVVDVGGQYEDTFNDVKMELISFFTFKAVRTVLEQLYELNPPQYQWFNNFVADNVPNNPKRFLQILVKERRDLAERVMITRLTLYGRWIKKCDHAEIYNEISDDNLKLMRERLLETIQWPSEDSTKPDQEKD